ncbi:MAG: very short patch repair endonuclease [Lachnospiraceae bacterium]|nr:very short patch repair endonuclease [Lachnospiraceae bacterium]
MADVLTKEQRKRNMQSIKSSDTEIERILLKALWEKGIMYRKNFKGLLGSPDIVLTKYKIVVFCDSEFFHGKDWDEQKKRLGKGDNGIFWVNKISKNIERDMDVNRSLEADGWKVIRFWGREIKKNTNDCVKTVEEAIIERKITGLDSGYKYEIV